MTVSIDSISILLQGETLPDKTKAKIKARIVQECDGKGMELESFNLVGEDCYSLEFSIYPADWCGQYRTLAMVNNIVQKILD